MKAGQVGVPRDRQTNCIMQGSNENQHSMAILLPHSQEQQTILYTKNTCKLGLVVYT